MLRGPAACNVAHISGHVNIALHGIAVLNYWILDKARLGSNGTPDGRSELEGAFL